jgi:hypothetical protein
MTLLGHVRLRFQQRFPQDQPNNIRRLIRSEPPKNTENRPLFPSLPSSYSSLYLGNLSSAYQPGRQIQNRVQ